MKSSIARLIALGLTAAFLLVGCGSSASSITNTGTSIRSTLGSAPSTTPTAISTPGPMPDDIPVYQGSRLLVAQYITTGTLYFYQVADAPAPVSQFYLAQMPQNGWQQETAEQAGEQGVSLVYTKDDRSVTMNIVPDPMIAADTDISIILANS
jgi:hypothetical protein